MTLRSGSLARAALGLALAGGWLAAPIALQAEPAATPKPDARSQQCFYARDINNFVPANDQLVYLRVGVADVYRLDLMTNCPELSFRQNVEFSRSGIGNICSAIDLEIRFRQNGIRRVCPVSEMRKLTPAEVAALPRRDRP